MLMPQVQRAFKGAYLTLATYLKSRGNSTNSRANSSSNKQQQGLSSSALGRIIDSVQLQKQRQASIATARAFLMERGDLVQQSQRAQLILQQLEQRLSAKSGQPVLQLRLEQLSPELRTKLLAYSSLSRALTVEPPPPPRQRYERKDRSTSPSRRKSFSPSSSSNIIDLVDNEPMSRRAKKNKNKPKKVSEQYIINKARHKVKLRARKAGRAATKAELAKAERNALKQMQSNNSPAKSNANNSTNNSSNSGSGNGSSSNSGSSNGGSGGVSSFDLAAKMKRVQELKQQIAIKKKQQQQLQQRNK
jgi:uncharacterized membrane protein YgcG